MKKTLARFMEAGEPDMKRARPRRTVPPTAGTRYTTSCDVFKEGEQKTCRRESIPHLFSHADENEDGGALESGGSTPLWIAPPRAIVIPSTCAG